VDQVRTGAGVYVPADGSAVRLQFSVEVDANCSRPPNPTYYAYPQHSYLYTWSNIDPSFWLLAGFSLAQTNPPYYNQYCPNPYICPVAYGVASILNFVDFADFLDMRIPFRGVPYRNVYSEAYTLCASGTAGWTRKVFGQVFDVGGVAFVQDGIPMTEQVFLSSRNDLELSRFDTGNTTTSYDPYAQPPRHGAYDDWFFFCSKHCPGAEETDAIQTLIWNGFGLFHSNLLIYKCSGITVDGH
jgi:hypothetical protein